MFRRKFSKVRNKRPKNHLSLSKLKHHYSVLKGKKITSEKKRSKIIESLRSIGEIVVWGDQNDPEISDYFLENKILPFLLQLMLQIGGNPAELQFIQTFNIMYNNIKNEKFLYYLLSNVNSIIVHRYDFNNEDIMGHYITFLKTLSLKLSSETIYLFYNERTNAFPLYTEAIKYYNHSDSMVRTSVRTIIQKVYSVENPNMLQIVREITDGPYFSDLSSDSN
ncbi:protein CLEC16A homolog [Uranotaenia lowii]|uniref:protein CLEC16A homolog n=1 Tax=Uranotaenia lowii TaxID=190385 RepID=UPI00247A80FF|nr:protein CLEC16A homolog [Uranotaenia lowii]